MAEVHENTRTMRKVRNLSQEQMAKNLEMSVSAYGKIERGETLIIHHKLEKIAEILEVDIMDLVKGHYYNYVSDFKENQNAVGVIQNQNNYHSDSELLHKIELLENKIKHQQETIKSKDREIKLLEKLLEKNQSS